ncbi:non-homologous end-joining DNA ligase [Paraburkholderia sp. J94]|uniref:non-homologous end-joining DNA ligase n=1 Tax=Paraburkholderia sp. J94 TaxID=2805441 RepID=UPI002AB159F2|nr:non-homologous end-joining DNA ligase [Paraburkholderia sp. J94]
MQDALKAESAQSSQSTPTRTPTGVRAQAPDASALASHPASTPRAPRATAPRKRSGRASITGEVAGIRITSARRVIDAQTGIRKLDLVRYYARAAPLLLPHLRDRPVSLLRAPQGLAGETLFQRHSARAPIDGVTQHEGLDPGHPAILSIDTLDALVHVAQMDTIELHTWNALASDVEQTDRVVFDLDPDPALGWDRMIEAAQLTRGILADLGLEAFCKTSGGKGLHVVVPVVPGTSWDESKAFARAVAQRLASGWPTQFTATLSTEHRKKKIFVDYLRNARGASTAVAWGVRARPGMGVSVPISWDELPETTGGAQWTLANIDARIARVTRSAHGKSADPWARYASVRQTVTSELTLRLEEGGA